MFHQESMTVVEITANHSENYEKIINKARCLQTHNDDKLSLCVPMRHSILEKSASTEIVRIRRILSRVRTRTNYWWNRSMKKKPYFNI